MPCSSFSVVDFEYEFVCLVIISLVALLRCLNVEFKGNIMKI